MAEGKKGFVLYCDQRGTFDNLPDEMAGQLIKHLFAYVNDESPESNGIIEALFDPIKQQLKRDLKKYQDRADRSRQNGAKGGRPKKPRETQNNPVGFLDNPEEPRETQTKPRKPDIGNRIPDTGNRLKDTVIQPEKVFSAEIESCYQNCIPFFDEHLQPKTPKDREKWKTTIDRLNRIDGIPFEQIEQIVEWARKDDFWRSNVLSMANIRKKNEAGVPKIVSIYEKMKPKQSQDSYKAKWERIKNL